jgi:tetratricopeptide (TPR) repeat protein
MNTENNILGLQLFEDARAAMDAGDLLLAINLFQQSSFLSPHYKSLLLLGECLIHTERDREAIIPLAAATALNNQGVAPTLLCEVFLRQGDPIQAKRFLDMAVDRQPHYKRARDLIDKVSECISKRHKEMGIDD